MLELYQTEWCPASRRVRERLTELGLDYIVRQVPVERQGRTMLVATTGAHTIPTLQLEHGAAIVGEDAIAAYLDQHFDEPPEAEAHRVKAAELQAATSRRGANVHSQPRPGKAVIVSGSLLGRAPIVRMPHWGGILTPADFDALVAYLSTLNLLKTPAWRR
jgi:glutathione S-transferase